MEVSPVVKWSTSISSKNQEHGSSGNRNKIERQQCYELNNLAQGEWCINRVCRWGTKAAGRVASFGVYYPRGKNKLLASFIDKYRVKYINQSFVNKESLEECRDNRCAFTQYQECAVDPSSFPLEEC